MLYAFFSYRMDPQEGRSSSVCSPQCWESQLHCLLSAGRTVRSVFFFKFLSASLSALVKLSLGLELFVILMVSSLASAISTGRDCTAFSTPAKMTSIGIVCGVTAWLRPFYSNEDTPSSSVWPLRLTTITFEVFVVRCCFLWSRENFFFIPTRL